MEVRLLAVEPGFDSDHVLTLATQMPMEAQAPGQRAAVMERVRAELLAVPGVVDELVQGAKK